MSSIELRNASTAGAANAQPRLAAPARRKHRHPLLAVLGGFVMTGLALALSAAVFPVAAVYCFIWFAQH